MNRNEVATMYAVIRAYAGNSELADTLVEHEADIRQVVGGIDGFKGYYLLKLAEGTSTISVFDDREGAEESTRAAAAWLAENLPNLDVAAPYVTAGEVLLAF
jgi:fatty acid/phospholipid biosynthesis enzyme